VDRVRFQAGLNDYEYCASLHIIDSFVPAAEISNRLALIPTRLHESGDARRNSSIYEKAYWATELPAKASESYDEFLSSFCSQFEEHADTLKEIHESGGRIELFIGLFAIRCCDASISCETLLRLGQLRIALRLDYYGPDSESPSG
jgi:hypothetical protein